MKIIEVFNAVSMIAPFIAWIKHRRRKSNDKLHKYLPVQIVVSFLYHMTSAISGNKRLIHLLRVIDISSIHICSFCCSSHGLQKIPNQIIRRIFKYTSIYTSIPLLIIDIIKNLIRRNYVNAHIRMIIIAQNNIFFLGILKRDESFSLILTTTLCFHFYKNTDRGFSHVYFHLLLYDVFDQYWSIT